MRLILTMRSLDGSATLTENRRVIETGALTIGRGPENDWVLADPHRHISKNHCLIEFDGGRYRLTDTSTNGVFLNGAAEAVGRGAGVDLNQGDRIRLGHYEIGVELSEAGAGDPYDLPPPYEADAPAFGSQDPFASVPPPSPDPFGAGSPDAFAPPAPQDAAEPFGAPADDPFAPAAGDPFAPAAGPGPFDAPAAPQAAGGGNSFDPIDDPLRRDRVEPDDPFGLGDLGQPGPDDPFASAPPSATDGADPLSGAPDPLAQRSRGLIGDDIDFLGSGPADAAREDHLAAERQAFVPPETLRRPDTRANERLPSDWDFDGDPLDAAPPPMPQPVPQPPAPPPQAMPQPTPQPVPRPTPPAPPPPLAPEPGIDDDMPFDLGPAKASAASHPAGPTAASGAAPAPPAPPPVAPAAPMPPPQQAAAPAAPTAGDPVAVLLTAAGIDPASIPPERLPEVMRLVGGAFRASVQGLVEVLRVRASLKEEFRVSERTMLRAAENNPLKFVLDLDQALDATVLRPRHGFLPADQAVQEGFQDVKAHLLAEAAGMQVALKALLKRFDPPTLQQRMDQSSVWDNILPGSRKARYWELFVELYEQIAKEAESDFHGLFGREFTRAYEEQSRRL